MSCVGQMAALLSWTFQICDRFWLLCEQTLQTWSQIVPGTRRTFTDTWWYSCEVRNI